jgi:hypothetical protein
LIISRLVSISIIAAITLTAVFISISASPLAFASKGQDNVKVVTHYLEQVKEYCEHASGVYKQTNDRHYSCSFIDFVGR